jgi:uncharacterized membrane protein
MEFALDGDVLHRADMAEYVDGWNAVMQPTGITSQDLAALRRIIAGDE